jgi:hypothetical protein
MAIALVLSRIFAVDSPLGFREVSCVHSAIFL